MEIENPNSPNNLDEFENNHSINKYTIESHSVVRESQNDFYEELEDFEDEKTQISEKSGSRIQGKKPINNISEKEKPPMSGKSKMIKKSASQKKDYPLKKSSSNKIGKNLQNVFKKGGGKNTKISAYANGTLVPGDGTKKKYAKSPTFKTYQELVQIIQNMQKFDWIEAAGITNKNQLGNKKVLFIN